MSFKLHPGYRVIWLNPESNQEVKATIKTVYKNKVKLIFTDLSTETVSIEDVELATLKPKNLDGHLNGSSHNGGKMSKRLPPLGDSSPKNVLPFYEDYKKARHQYPDCLILYSIGEYLEAYGDDADRLADLTDLVKTTKVFNERGDRINLTGFPTTSKKYLLELWTLHIKFQICKEGGEVITLNDKIVTEEDTGCEKVDTREMSVGDPTPKDALLKYGEPSTAQTDCVKNELSKKGSPYFEFVSNSNYKNSLLEPTNSLHKTEYLDITEIRLDGGTQQRVKLDLNHVKNLESQLEEGHELEPITVFFDGTNHWLADGFHRVKAIENHTTEQYNGTAMSACRIMEGDQRDAILYSVGANSDHKPCLPRSNADKRRSVECLLNDPYWTLWSDREIARNCKVSDRFVNSVRKTICEYSHSLKPDKIKVTRGGKEYEMTRPTQEDTGCEKVDTREMSVNEREQNDTVITSPPTPIHITTEEVLIGFLSNIDYMTREQLEAAQRAIFLRFTQLNEQEKISKCQTDLSQKAS